MEFQKRGVKKFFFGGGGLGRWQGASGGTLRKAEANSGMKISQSKIECMCVNGEQWRVRGEAIVWVKDFK